MLGKIEGKKKKKKVAEDEMVRQYHQLNGHEFEQTLGYSERRESGMLQSIGLQWVGHDLAAEQ